MTDEPYDPTRPGPPREVHEDAAARETRTLDKQAMAICYDHNLSIDVAVAITNAMLEAHAAGKSEGAAEERRQIVEFLDTLAKDFSGSPGRKLVSDIATTIRQRSEAPDDR